MPKLSLSALAIGCVLCGACASLPRPRRHFLGGRDFVERIAPGVWRHVTYHRLPKWGPFPANGLIVSTPRGAVIVDTTWTAEQAEAVLEWTRRNLGAVAGVVVTHAHDDRNGGLAAFMRRRIRILARGDLAPLEVAGEVFFPGRAHAPDNVVVWVEAPKVLFGGCLVRALSTDSLGNTSDADLASWRRAVAVLRRRYRLARIVVPGHGRPGDVSLLSHTARLLAKPPPPLRPRQLDGAKRRGVRLPAGPAPGRN